MVYSRLATGRCAEAQEYLDLTWWRGFESPEYVVMLQVAIDMCAGRTESATAQFERGRRMYAWVGVRGVRNLCNIYRAFTSYSDQVPLPSTSACPSGSLAPWPGGAWPATDDPRTDAIEAVPPSDSSQSDGSGVVETTSPTNSTTATAPSTDITQTPTDTPRPSQS